MAPSTHFTFLEALLMDTRKLLLPTLIAAVLAAPLAFAQDPNADASKDPAATEQPAPQADAAAADATAAADKADAEKDKKDKKTADGEQPAEPEEDDKK